MDRIKRDYSGRNSRPCAYAAVSGVWKRDAQRLQRLRKGRYELAGRHDSWQSPR